MHPQARVTSAAYTYAWWLTGDDSAAEAAVRRALEHVAPEDLSDEAKLKATLATVRREAAPTRTMCPASELALLHDGHDVPLDDAAELADVLPDDARTELAHGRLEALLETIRDPFRHPERLGGLAVGNPPDVAHARVCDSCAQARTLLLRGRQELCALPLIPAPASLLAAVHGTGETATAAGPLPVGRRRADASPQAAAPAPEQEAAPDEEPAPGEEPAPAPPRRRRRPPVVAAAAILLGVLVLVVTALTGNPSLQQAAQTSAAPGSDADASSTSAADTALPARDLPPDDDAAEPTALVTERDDPPTSPTPTAGASPEAPTTRTVEPTAGPWPELAAVEGFSITRAQVLPSAGLGAAGVVRVDGAVRVVLAYTGAPEGTPLRARLAAAGEVSQDIRVEVSGDGTHVLAWPAPDEGWPPGRHQVVVTTAGEVVAVVHFSVA